MEGNDWYNTGYTDYRNHYRGDERPIDQDVFRGSYRFDNDSPHHNETTYNGFREREERHESPRTYERRPELENREQNLNNYNTRAPRRDRNQGRVPYNYGNRYEQGYWQDEETNQPESMYRSRSVFGNFEGNYDPDRYRPRTRDENYGNMAGSLSVGYDGEWNADWEEHRYYNPLTGHRRSYHGNYTSRHPEAGNERRQHNNRNDRDNYERY
ncbi:hypothetical protein [Pontibacter pudoricolor]|uniref:hypothetical protein n=1 Tax=Pontibacter pudoricolor TaxID=2694930 RepID=UPI0013911E1C|nr:hypothetical protein [Pontibacter pudoricolor]